MADEKKLKNEELTDEQANEAAGGIGTNSYTCEGGCGKFYAGNVPHLVNGKPCCVNCYAKYQQSHHNKFARPDHREKP